MQREVHVSKYIAAIIDISITDNTEREIIILILFTAAKVSMWKMCRKIPGAPMLILIRCV